MSQIHHYSIPVQDTRHVAEVLCELFDGTITPSALTRTRTSSGSATNTALPSALELSRGSFNVIEFWIENRVMIELLTLDMARDYLAATRKFRYEA